MRGEKIKVLIVDDSASVRQGLTAVLESDPDIAVIGTASDPFVAARKLTQCSPDVITLDVEMPRMDGLTFLKKLMNQHPLPVVMCSSLVESGSQTLQQALEAGAVDIILKPAAAVAEHLSDARIQICDTIKAAAHARIPHHARRPAPAMHQPEKKLTADVMLPPPTLRPLAKTTAKVVCIGASTGGTESLREVLTALPANAPGIVVVQHMPEKFTASFAKRLNDLCAMEVKEAADGDGVLQGRVLIAPGNRHTMLTRCGARYQVSVKDGPLVSRHRPSVDVLFRSAAATAGANGVGIIMTGMGDDGARGLEEMKRMGATTIAQDEATSIVFGMPREAIARGCVDRIVPLSSIATELLRATAAVHP
jgi:two-component system chemotaxis response regulator CheB